MVMKQLALVKSYSHNQTKRRMSGSLSSLLSPVSSLSLTSFLHHSQICKECGKVGVSHSPSDSMSDGSSSRKSKNTSIPSSFFLIQLKRLGYNTANKHKKTEKKGCFPGISRNKKSHDDKSSGFLIASYILDKTL